MKQLLVVSVLLLSALPSCDGEPSADAGLDAPADAPSDAGDRDVPADDAPGADAPGLDAPAVDAPAPAYDVDLVFIQGESNAAGIADDASATAAELAPFPDIQILNNTTLTFEDLDIGSNNEIGQYVPDPPNQHGLELGLLRAVADGRLPPLYLVKCGASGSWVQQWQPGDERDLWGECAPRMDAALAALREAGHTPRITVWQSLGLNDRYQRSTTPEEFRTGMDALRAAFRDAYGADMVFLSTRFDNPPAQSYDWAYIFDDIAAADPLAFSIDVSGATYVDGSVHYDYDGFILIADRMVETMGTLR